MTMSRFGLGWGKNFNRMFGQPFINTFMIRKNYWFDI